MKGLLALWTIFLFYETKIFPGVRYFQALQYKPRQIIVDFSGMRHSTISCRGLSELRERYLKRGGLMQLSYFVLGSCPTYYQPDQLKGSTTSLTRPVRSGSVVCSSNTNHCGRVADGIADGSPEHSWATADPVEQWVWFYFIKKSRINAIRLKQLNADEKQVKTIELHFEPAKDQMRFQISSQPQEWQSFRFSRRESTSIRIKALSVYAPEKTFLGFQEIEVFEENAGKDLLCEHITVAGADLVGVAAEDNLIYPVSGGFVAITLSFSSGVVSLLFVDDGFANSYEVKVDLTNPVTFTLTDAGGAESTPVTVSQPVGADVRFWVDFSSDKFVVGMELAELISTSHTLSSISQMTITPDSSTVVSASVCSHRGTCMDDATHHWPMDKLDSGGLGDIAGNQRGFVKGGATIVNTGPHVHQGFTTGAISLTENTIGNVDLGDISALAMMDFDSSAGWTFSFWLRFDTLRNLTGEATKFAPFIYVGGILHLARRSPSTTGLWFDLHKGQNYYNVVIDEALVTNTWTHWTLTWFKETFTVHRNLVGIFRAVRHPTNPWNFSHTPLLIMGCTWGYKNDPKLICDDVSFSDVVFWNRRLSQRELMDKFQCSGYRFGAPKFIGLGSGRTPDSGFLASSSLNQGSDIAYPHLARAGLQSSVVDAWMPSRLDDDPFLQVDLNQWVKVTEVAVEGSKAAAGWVTGYSLSYKQNVAPWKFVPYITNHSVEAWLYKTCGPRIAIQSTSVASDGSPTIFQGPIDCSTMVSNVLVEQVVTRFLRFHPKTWIGAIAMKVEVVAEPAENYEGCFEAEQEMPREDFYDGDNMTPEVCTTLCGQSLMTYALLKAGTQCYCADALPSVGDNIADNLCGRPCSGKPGLKCGGTKHVAVYKALGTYATPTFTLTIPTTVNLGENVSFSVSALPESDYTIDFGNGQTMRSFQTDMFFAFPTAGKFMVRASATTSEYGEPVLVSAETEVEVKVPVVSSLVCPSAVETSEEFECTLNLIQSSNADFTLDFFGGIATSSDSVAETLQGVVGDDVTPNIKSTETAGVYLLPDLKFESEGKVQLWEVLAMKPGVIRLLVIRAVCLFNVSEPYISSDGASLEASECASITCTTGEQFCIDTASCVPSTQACASQASVRFATKYEVVHEYIGFVFSGLNILAFDEVQLPELPNVGPGYSIAFDKPAGSGAELASIDQVGASLYLFADEISSLGKIFDTASAKFVAEKVHIKSYYSMSSSQVFKGTYADVGVFNPRARFTVGAVETDFTSKIVVSEPIEGGNWTVAPSPYVATNATFSVSVQPLTRGYNVTTTILYDDETNYTQFDARLESGFEATHAYSTRGLKPLSLTYSNALSSVELSCQMKVEDEVDYLDLVEPIIVVPTGNESDIVWYLLQGSDLTFEFDLGDGTFYSNGTFDVDGGVLIVFASHVYSAPGEYDVNITVYNDVSNRTLTAVAAVEDPIVNMTADVVHVARDIEVNETVLFNVTMLNGTSPYYLVDFGDGSDEFGLNRLVNHSYSWWQVFRANVTAWNNVSEATYLLNVTVHKPVEPLINFTITVEPTNLTDPTAFMLNISEGTDYNCTWDFGDGSQGENNYDHLGTYLYHTYNDVGVYNVFMNCSNRLYTINYTTVAIIQRPMLGFEFPEMDPIKYTEPLVIQWWCASGTNATYNVTVDDIYLNDAPLLFQNQDVTLSADRLIGSHTVFPMLTHQFGVYLIEITVWNHVTPPQIIRRELIIDKPIEAAVLSSVDTHWEVNTTVTVTTTMDLGTNVTLVFDFGDGNTYEEFFMGEFPTNAVDTNHTFLTDGEFVVTLLVKNSVSNVTLELPLQLQYVPDLSLESNSPQIHPSPAIVNFTLLVNPGKEPPTNATSVWDFGDGSPLETKTFDYYDSHFYAEPGWYIVVVKISNVMGEMNITGYADVQRVIVTPEVWPVNTAGDNGDGGAGSGPLGITFPEDYPVRFMTQVADGTNVTYTLDYGDGTSDSTNETFLEHQFSSPGTHLITVTVNNSVSSFEFTITIVLEAVVKDITVENDSPTVYGTPMTFTVSIGQLGNESCFYFTMKNDSFITFKPERTTTCTKPGFSTDVRTFPGNSFTFEYIYDVAYEYPVTIEGQNFASSVTTDNRAVVVLKPCHFPKAVVIEVGKNVSTARQFIKSRDTVVPTENVIDCEAAVYSKFEWRVFLYDPTRPHIPPGENETSYFHEMINITGIQYDAPRLVVKPRALDYGIYKAIENVTMIGPQGVWHTDDGFFEIVKSPLYAIIIGGSTRSVGFDKNFTLDANSSGDPDVDVGDREGIQVYWLCKRQSENVTFPEDPGNLTAITMVPRAVSHGQNASDLGGCYGNGPGLLDFNGYLLVLNSGYMHINETYDLRFFIRKGNRTAFYDSSVLVVAGDPPQMAIRCDMNCLAKFNPSEKITLTALCTSCTPSSFTSLQYKWTLSVQEGDTWINVDLAALAKTPLTRETLVIGGGQLEGGKLYRIRITSWFKGSTSRGFAELAKFINVPPTGGRCVTTPATGYALKEIFTVSCEGWEDTELPLRYNIKYKNGLDGLESGIYDGLDAVRYNMSMPLGQPIYNNTIFVYISVADSLGAFTTVETKIKVIEEEMSDEAFSDLLSSMTADNGALGNLIAEGNAQAMCQMVGAVTSLLNNKAEPEPEVIATTAAPTRGAPRNPKELAAEQARRAREEEERRRREEEAKRQRIAAREKMVGAMSNIQVDSVTTVQQTSSALQSLLSTPDEVSPNAQATASAAMENMADFMLSNAGVTSGSALTSAATGLVSGLGYMVSASSSTVGKSENNDTSSSMNATATKEMAKAVVAAINAATDKVFKALSSQTALGEEPVSIQTPAMALAAVKKLPSEVAGSEMTIGGGGKFGMPKTPSSDNSSDPVDMKGVGTKDNAYSWDPSASSVQTQVMSLELRDVNGDPIPVANLTEPISLFVATGQTPSVPSLVTLSHRAFVYHMLTIDKNDTSIHFEINPQDPNTEIIAYLKRGARPTREDYDFMQVVPDEPPINATYPKDRHMFYVSNGDTNRTTAGTWYLGVFYNGTLSPQFKLNSANVPKLFIPKKVNYTLRMYSSGCLFWDKENDKWSGDGCVVGPQSKMDKVQCLCTHLTSFAGDFFVMPNAIDWSKISLDNLFSNPTVFAVVMTIFGLYIIGMIWARKKDKEDLLTIGTTPLADNDPRDTYLYEIVFYTGHSAGAGTTGNVYIILEGSVDEIAPRAMKDEVRVKFTKSAIDTFLLAVPSSLGRLKTLRVWHDNAGQSPGWFLQRVLVQDMQTDKKTWFLCDKWLAVEEDDGLIERTLVPASRDDLTSFHLLFSTEARKSLTDNHLWFSVVKRPARSTFTRCQRLSCCLTIILTTMLANAMFFQTDSTSSTGTELRAGPISFSVKQLSIAITSSLVVLPANILIVTLFRKAGPKQPKTEKNEKYSPENEEDGDGDEETEKKKDEVIKVEEVSEEDKKQKKKKKKGKYPHWVIYVAYVVVAIASLVSATFTVFYGLTFGEEKSQKWIMTMMISFWQDVLISQPLKVFAAATFFALVIKNPDKAVEEEEENKKADVPVKTDEELVHNEKTEEEEMEDLRKLAMMPKQPDQVKLEEMRRFKLKQKLMYKIIKEILSYVVFVLIILTVAYGNRDYKSHHVNNALTSYFMGGTYAGRMALDDISDIKDFYKYLRNSLLPTLKPDFWYGPYDEPVSKVKTADDKEMYALTTLGFNGSKTYHEVHPYPQGYTADRANAWLVGIARIRQLRVLDKGCSFPKGVQHLVGRCSHPYSFDYEDEGYYEPGWVPMNKSKIEKIKNDEWFKSPWSYKKAWQLKGTPYWGYFHTYWAGGFVSELSASYEEAINRSIELENLNWLDGKTRAVFFEFTIYNPFTNFFAVVNILTEILATGGYYPYPYIATTRLYRYIGAEAKVIMVLELVFFAYLLYYIVREGKELRAIGKRAYFREAWNYFDILVIVSSILSIVFYFMRLVATKIVIARANEDPYSFTNFNYVVVLDGFVSAFMGLTVFVSFLKFLRLLRFNRTIGKLASTLRACVAPLASFFLLFMIVFLAYAQFAFLIFGPEMTDYSSFDRCLSNMLGMTLGSFDFNALSSTNRILGPIFFFTYILAMVMILMNVFLSIINDTFNEVNSDVSKQSSDSEIADFMMDRFVATVKRTGATIQPIYKEPKDKLDQNLDDIEELSDNVQLVLRSLCLESIRHTSWFKTDDVEESEKKRQILELLLISGENFTESEVCDAIPVLDTVLARYSAEQLKTITKNFQEKLAREEREDGEKMGGHGDDNHDGDDDDDGDEDSDDSTDNSNSDRDENVFDVKDNARFDF